MPVIHLVPSLHRPAGTEQCRMWVAMATASQNLKIPAANNINHHVKRVRENFKKRNVSPRGQRNKQSEALWSRCFESAAATVAVVTTSCICLNLQPRGGGPFPKPEASHTSALELNKKLILTKSSRWFHGYKHLRTTICFSLHCPDKQCEDIKETEINILNGRKICSHNLSVVQLNRDDKIQMMKSLLVFYLYTIIKNQHIFFISQLLEVRNQHNLTGSSGSCFIMLASRHQLRLGFHQRLPQRESDLQLPPVVARAYFLISVGWRLALEKAANERDG